MIILREKIAGLSAVSLGRFVLRVRRAAHLPGKVNILITGSAELRSLNRQFRNRDKATDVLSFPFASDGNGKLALAGEIVISADIASDNAARLGHPPAVEVKILALHGILHLAGYDHESDNGKMVRKESALRRKLGLPSSLTERSAPAGHQAVKAHNSPRVKRRRRPS